jgi:hypothetical protein
MKRMTKNRNVSKAPRRGLKAKSAEAGRSRSDDSLAELQKTDYLPALAEFCERLRARKPLAVALDTARLVREERATR